MEREPALSASGRQRPEKFMSYGTMETQQNLLTEQARLHTEMVDSRRRRRKVEEVILSTQEGFEGGISLSDSEEEEQQEPERDPNLIYEGVWKINLLMLLLFLARGISISVFAPFLPLEMESHDYNVYYVGPILAATPFSQMMFANTLPRLSKGRKRKAFSVSSFCYGLIMLGFSLLMLWKPSEPLFVSVAIFLRLLQGLLAKLFSVIFMTIIIRHYQKKDRLAASAIFSFSYGGGQFLGPFVGGILYNYFGYHGTFIFISATFFSFVPFYYIVFTDIIDQDKKSSESQSKEQEEIQDGEQPKKSENMLILGNPKVLSFFATVSLIGFTSSFFEPILALHLERHFKFEVASINYFFLILPVLFFLGTVVYFFKFKRSSYKTIEKGYVLGLVVTVASHLLMGPSRLFPDSWEVMAVGFAVFCLANPFTRTPYNIIMNQKIEEEFGKETANELIETSSSLVVLFVSIGNILGYFMSPLMVALLGFRTSYEIVAVLTLIPTILYFTIGNGKEAFNL